MHRVLALLPVLVPVALAACSGPLDMPPRGGAPAGQRDAAVDACRAEATRIVQFRDRTQTMRTDETESGRGTVTVAPFSRAENDRGAAQIDRDRIIQDCLRANRSGTLPGTTPVSTR